MYNFWVHFWAMVFYNLVQLGCEGYYVNEVYVCVFVNDFLKIDDIGYC